jgi:hypothetical protein
MPASRVTDSSLILRVAAVAGYPSELPSYGTKIEYNNHNYLLAIRNGEYVVIDISVYSSSGELTTDTMDIIIDEATGAVQEIRTEIGKWIILGLALWFGGQILIKKL